MIGWIVRVLLLAAGTIAAWFVARDAPNFGVVQGVVAVLLLALAVFVLAFWPFPLGRGRAGRNAAPGSSPDGPQEGRE